MAVPYIENWDTGRVAREKINAIMDEVNASIPSIGENGHRYIGGVDTGIMAGYTVRADNNLINLTNNEIYADLQFGENLTPVSNFPIWVTVGNVKATDGRPKAGMLLNARTSNTYCRWLYGSDSKLYFDGGNWIFKTIATTEDIGVAIAALRAELADVAFTWKASDLDNDEGFNSVPVLTEEEYIEIPGTATDNKRYFIYEEVNE